MDYAFDDASPRQVYNLAHVFFAAHEHSEHRLISSEHDAHLKLGAVSRRHATNSVATAHRKRTGGGRPEIGSHMIQNHVHAPASGYLLHSVSDILFFVVDNLIRA